MRLLASTHPADSVATEPGRCRRPSCTNLVPPQKVRRGKPKAYCSDACRTAHWDELHPRLPLQTTLPIDPEPIRVAIPPHDRRLSRKLQKACLDILGLLGDLRPHSRHELEAVAGNRYGSRIGELRAAGHRILGPRKSPRHRIFDVEPWDEVEMYRLEMLS